jgi:hypothetical protein
MKPISPKVVMVVCTLFFVLGAFFPSQSSDPITHEVIASAEKLIGLSFTDAKRDSMIDGLADQLKNYENIRKIALPNRIPPALVFNIPSDNSASSLSPGRSRRNN